MKGYLLIDTEIIDQGAFGEFAPRIVEAVGAHGGRFLVRGGAIDVADGDWAPHRIVLIEFDSLERTRTFLGSPEYAALRELRDRCMRTRTIVLEGYDPGA